MRSIDTGDTLTLADPATLRTSLSAMQNAEFSEQGALFISPEGNIIFKNRSSVIASAGVTPTNWNEPLAPSRPARSADRAKMPHSLGGSCSDSRCTWGTSSYVCPCWCLPCGRVGSN